MQKRNTRRVRCFTTADIVWRFTQLGLSAPCAPYQGIAAYPFGPTVFTRGNCALIPIWSFPWILCWLCIHPRTASRRTPSMKCVCLLVTSSSRPPTQNNCKLQGKSTGKPIIPTVVGSNLLILKISSCPYV